MSEYNNPRPLPTASASDPCTVVDNAVSLDKVINGDSTVTTYTGKQILSLSQAVDKFGFGVAPFTFTTGGTLESKNLLVSNVPVDSFLYKYVGSGSFPLTISAGTNPTVGSDWQPFAATDHNLLSNRNAVGSHDAIYDRSFGTITALLNTSDLEVGITVSTKGYNTAGDGGSGRYIVKSGTSTFPLIDRQSIADQNIYFKLLPMEGTNYSYSLLAAGGDNKLVVSDANSDIMSQLIQKIMSESPMIGGTIYCSGGQYWFSKSVTCLGAKHITVKGEMSTLSYNGYESKTIFYSDNSLIGDYVLDFDDTIYMSVVDLGLRGDLGGAPTKGGIFLGKKGTPQAGGGNALLERINVHGFGDGIFLQNCGISTLRDIQASNCLFRGVALETSGDSNLYNIYANTNNKDSVDTSVLSGTGLFIGRGSNNVNVFGGKLEFNSKGLVVYGSNGVTVDIQYDYNSMANVIVEALNDKEMACRGITLGNSRILSGGIVSGYEKSSIYTTSANGSVSVNILGGTLRAAGDGAFDNSTSGIIGPEVSIVANGNSTYDNQVTFDGDGLYMATAKNAIARGSKTKVIMAGLLPDDIGYDEVSGGQVITKQSFHRLFTPTFTGSSGAPTYTANSGELRVVNGEATANFYIQLSSVGTLVGNITVSGMGVASKSPVEPALIQGVINNITGADQILGYISFGSSDIVLWKRTSAGALSLLNAADLQTDSLLRFSISFKV